MYSLAIIIQILATLACAVAVLIVAFKKTSSYSNVIVITFLCAFVQNGGYILELLSKNAGEGMMAVRAEYLGGAFEIGLMTFFIFKYCGHDLNIIVKSLIVTESVIVLLGVWTWEFTHAYYIGVDFVANATIPHLVMQHGWLYFTFSVTTIIELLVCIFILTVSILKTNQSHMKTNYTILLFVVVVPLLCYVLSITGVFGGYDVTPLSVAIAVSIFALALARKHVFDVADAAGELILSELENAIIILDNESCYEYSNKRAESLFPSLKTYSKGSLVRDWEILNIFDNTRSRQITIADRSFEVSVNKVKTNGVEIGTTAILFDVTDSQAQIEQMKALKEEAEDASKAKSAFLANVSHEIRTPINVIMGMSEVLLRDYSTEEMKDYLFNIRNSGNTLLNLISDIIDFSRIESGKLELNSEKFDMGKMLSELISIYRFRSEQKGLDFSYDISPDIPKNLIGDEVRIRQIATNLLSNSVQYTEKGNVKIRIGYKYRSDFDIDLILAVEDTGMGFKRENYEDLFSGSGRDKAADRHGDFNGTGLGLNITKQLVEMMGGILNYKSDVGKGTVFSVIIPLSIVPDNKEVIGNEIEKKVDEDAYRASFTAEEAEILVVDDSPINLQVMKELLKDMRPKLTFATSGEECLEIVREKHFDMIFMDHRMTGMDGVETFSRIKQSDNECKDTPVIMITANATNDARDWYLTKGFTDFILMPVSAERLSTMLYKYLPERLISIIE